jgi:vacuolar protein sorting-associated protein 13B
VKNDKDEWIESNLIYINNKPKNSIHYELPTEGTVQMMIHDDESNFIQLNLTSKYRGKKRLIHIQSTLVIANYSSFDLNAIGFYAHKDEKIDLVKKNILTSKIATNIPQMSKNDERKSGKALNLFHKIYEGKNVRKINQQHSNFITFKLSHNGEILFTCPLKIQATLRKCINVFNESDGMHYALTISIIKENDQFFMSIFNDKMPMLKIVNQTDFKLFLASTEIKEGTTKVLSPYREIADDRIIWYQIVDSRNEIFYTPPIFNDFFPDLINLDEYGIIFACVCGDDQIRWSQAIKIDESKNVIMNVPMFGDLILQVDKNHKITSEITIRYIESNETVASNILNNSNEYSNFVSADDRVYRRTFIKKNQTIKFTSKIYVEGLNLTLYKDSNEKRLEIISLSVNDLIVEYVNTLRKLKINFLKLQVDNELFHTGNYDFPVLVCNRENISKKSVDIDSLTAYAYDVFEIIENQMLSNNFSIDVIFFEHNGLVSDISVTFQPLRVYVEDSYVTILLDLLYDCIQINNNKIADEWKGLMDDGDLIYVPNSIYNHAVLLSEPIRINSLKISSLSVLLSVHACRHIYIALDHSPLDFSPYEKKNIYTLALKMGNSIGMHYLSAAIFGAGWFLASLEILGSPSGLARSVTTGIKDFISMPFQGLFHGPLGFFIGLSQGSFSLFRNVTAGTVNSVTKLANSLARNLDHLTLDSDHIDLKTIALRRSRPHGFKEGFQYGMTGFGISLLGAIGGLAHHPLQAKSAVDVFTGVGKGLIGVFTKPISGIAELLFLTGTGMLQSVGYNSFPVPLSHKIVDHLTEPLCKKILNSQLADYSMSTVLFMCRATFIKKNELKITLLILLTKSMIIVDLENDTIIDALLLKNLQSCSHKSTTSNNLFSFKLRKENTKTAKTSLNEVNKLNNFCF